jgi:hypothetical protein
MMNLKYFERCGCRLIEVPSRYFPEVTGENQENRIDVVWTEILTENLRNTSLGCYRDTDLLSEDRRLLWDNTEIIHKKYITQILEFIFISTIKKSRRK